MRGLCGAKRPCSPTSATRSGRWRSRISRHGSRRTAIQLQCRRSGCKFEGEGDALFAGDTLLAGYLKRSDIGAHRWMAEILGVPVLSLELTDDRWYHLDTCLFPLTPERVVYYPGAFDDYACRVIENTFETIQVNHDEALRFACNAVVLGKHVVLPSGCPQLTRTLEMQGYEVHSAELSEFLKAGGAAKCLTLLLR